MTLTAIISGFTPRYFPFPQPTSASTLPGGSEDRKWQTRGQGEWRVLLKWEAIASYTRCTYSSSRRAASAWQHGSAGGEGVEGKSVEGAPWLSQAEGKAGDREKAFTGEMCRSFISDLRCHATFNYNHIVRIFYYCLYAKALAMLWV